MWVRSPLGANVGTPSQYFMSVTAHGVSMAYVLTTFFIMGFGYFVAVTALNRPLPGKLWAWAAYWMSLLGVIVTVIPIATGQASVLFTFYPPLMASAWFYIGLVLVVAGIMGMVHPHDRRNASMEAEIPAGRYRSRCSPRSLTQ